MKCLLRILIATALGVIACPPVTMAQEILERQPGAKLKNWDGSFLKAGASEWLWSPSSPGQPELAALVLWTPVSYTLFPGSFEVRVSNGLSRAHRTGRFWTSSVLAGINGRTVKSAVPEPRIWLLIGLGSAFMLWNLRRPRRI